MRRSFGTGSKSGKRGAEIDFRIRNGKERNLCKTKGIRLCLLKDLYQRYTLDRLKIERGGGIMKLI